MSKTNDILVIVIGFSLMAFGLIILAIQTERPKYQGNRIIKTTAAIYADNVSKYCSIPKTCVQKDTKYMLKCISKEMVCEN